MAKTSTSGGRFKRAAPSGNHKGKKAKGDIASRPRSDANGPALARKQGETMLTPDLQARIVALIQAGNYAEVAARASGIHKSTFYEWLTRGGRGEEPFKALADAVEKAAAESEARDVMVIGKAAEKQWQAAAWRLERKDPKKWGRKDGLEITGDEQKPVAITVIKFGDDEIEFS
jgi:transposase-like protein